MSTCVVSVLAPGVLAGVGLTVGRRAPNRLGPALAAFGLLLLLRVVIRAAQRFERFDRRDGPDRFGPGDRSAATRSRRGARVG